MNANAKSCFFCTTKSIIKDLDLNKSIGQRSGERRDAWEWDHLKIIKSYLSDRSASLLKTCFTQQKIIKNLN